MPALQTPRDPSGLDFPLHPFELHGPGFEPQCWLAPELGDGLDVGIVELVWVETMVDVGSVVAARIGEPVLRVARSAPIYSVENELAYLEDVFLLANPPPTPPPTAPPMTKTTIMQRSQKVVGRKPQTRREL